MTLMAKSVAYSVGIFLFTCFISRCDSQCPLGYHGSPCIIRSCETLPPPSNGRFKSACQTTYQSKCEFECLEGYELKGSAERTCTVKQPSNTMEWSGTIVTCEAIECPLRFINNAVPPTGICSFPSGSVIPVYKTSCIFHCGLGYELKGSKVRVCQLDGKWSGTATSCEVIYCPKLPPVFGAVVVPSNCLNGPVMVHTRCEYRCAGGYHVDGFPTDIIGGALMCKTDKTWDAPVPKCHDFEPPILTCPNVLTTSTRKGKATGKVFWSVEVSDNSLSVDPHAKINISSSHLPSQALPIGLNRIKVNAIDNAGNVAMCTFLIEVRDTEPPTCSFCPADIVQEETNPTANVHWKRPVCSDNSGKPPSIASNRQSGDLFLVPSIIEVQYNVIDDSYNVNKNCSFRITLKAKSCPRFPPPRNGALACITKNSETCVVMCETGTDYEYNPSLLYICSRGQWQMFSMMPAHSPNIPWPNCSATANPSWIRMMIPDFFYNGDDPDFQDAIKVKFLALLKSPFIPPLFCRTEQCTKDDISVFVGAKG